MGIALQSQTWRTNIQEAHLLLCSSHSQVLMDKDSHMEDNLHMEDKLHPMEDKLPPMEDRLPMMVKEVP